jgi:hypothetical protein
MNADDPGDDVREYRLQQAERKAERGSSNWKFSIAIAIGGPILAAAFILWKTS